MDIRFAPETGLDFNLDTQDGSVNYIVTPTNDARLLPVYPIGYGYFIAGPAHYTERSGNHPLYQIFHTVRGEGRFRVNDREYIAGPGSFVLLDCSIRHRYESNNCIWEHEWVNFNGAACSIYFEMITRDGFRILSPGDSQSLAKLMNEIRSGFNAQDMAGVLHTSTRIISFLDAYYQFVVEEKRERIDDRHGDIMRSVRYIDSHYMEKITLDSLAQVAYLSKYYFIRAFKEYVGMKPHEYLDTVRISHAQRLLSNTSLSVEEIGLRTGFQSSKSFITKFKSTIGVTPGKFRKDSCAWRIKEKN